MDGLITSSNELDSEMGGPPETAEAGGSRGSLCLACGSEKLELPNAQLDLVFVFVLFFWVFFFSPF